jgi:hypothetical protein
MATGARSYVPKDGTLGHGIVDIAGYFEVNGTSNPTVTSGVGWTATYVSAGTWDITFDQKYTAMVGSGLAFHNASTTTDFTVEWKGTLTSNQVMRVQTKTGGTLTTPATATGTGISFNVALRRSRVAT